MAWMSVGWSIPSFAQVCTIQLVKPNFANETSVWKRLCFGAAEASRPSGLAPTLLEESFFLRDVFTFRSVGMAGAKEPRFNQL